jgi:hypothetical protein
MEKRRAWINDSPKQRGDAEDPNNAVETAEEMNIRANAPLRVLISTSTFPVHPGDGIARFVLDLALVLSKSCDVTVLAPHSPGAPRQEVDRGVQIRRFRYFLPSKCSVWHIAVG